MRWCSSSARSAGSRRAAAARRRAGCRGSRALRASRRSALATGGDGFDNAGGAASTELDLGNTAGAVTATSAASGGGTFFNGLDADGALATNATRGTSEGDGHAVTVNGSASGGEASGAGDGGDAESASFGRALGDSTVNVSDNAIGGLGGSAEVGGHARSHAEGSSQGDASVSVFALARGGAGGQLGRGGSAEATATGSSLRGAVSVSARHMAGRSGTGADGADLAALDSVTGSTAGRLTLYQSASGGSSGEQVSGSPTPLRGGDARSELHATNPGGGDLDASVEAFGALGFGGRGGHAVALGTAEGAADVKLSGRALAGEGTAVGGDASIEPLFARSTGGGEVEVIAHVTSGTEAVLDNVIDGETTGVLRLTQRAEGRAGATTLLDRAASNEHLVLRSVAEGRQVAGDGALADALARSRNELGGADASSESRGGSSTGGASARGGEALARSFATALAELRDAEAHAQAAGGNAGTVSGAGALDGVAGGSATSEASALAEAVLAVAGSPEAGPADASARAIGGRGGVLDQAIDAAGRGGDAAATATASGGEQVFADAHAEGGSSGLLGGGAAGAGGDARAIATAAGVRDVSAHASAVGGAGAAGSQGSAFARAEASGKGGEVAAHAGLSDAAGFVPYVLAHTTASLKGDMRVGASMAAGALASDDEALGFLNAARFVSDAALDEALAGNTNVGAALEGAQALALLATGTNAAERSLTFESELTMNANVLAPSVGDDLLIGFLDPELGGIKKLEVVVSLGGQVVFEGRAKRGKPLLDDQVLVLTPAAGQFLVIAFEIKAGKSTESGALDLVIATRGAAALAAAPAVLPEPRGLALVAAALLVAARAIARRGASRSSAS